MNEEQEKAIKKYVKQRDKAVKLIQNDLGMRILNEGPGMSEYKRKCIEASKLIEEIYKIG